MRLAPLLWLIAVVLTLFLARHQRVTGPTYPLGGRAALGAHAFAWELKRTHAGPGDQRVEVKPGLPEAAGTVSWRLHVEPTASPGGPGTDANSGWALLPMRREGDALVAALPHQPVAHKLDYYVMVFDSDSAAASARSDAAAPQRGSVRLPPAGHATIRFRNDVPVWVLLPHIAFMFVAMLLSTRAGLEGLERKPNFAPLVDFTLLTLFIGGFPLGFAMSGFAFGEPWGGFPLGNDATDNKTLVAFAGWLGAWLAVRSGRGARVAVPAAALIMFVVYLIPHSLALPK